jgi:DNA-binding PadR family transcriptional regulator
LGANIVAGSPPVSTEVLTVVRLARAASAVVGVALAEAAALVAVAVDSADAGANFMMAMNCACLSSRSWPMRQHGYQLIRAFAEKSGGAYQPSPGVLYPLLVMLSEMELVVEVDTAGSKRRLFAISETGRAEIEGKGEQIEALFGRLTALAAQAERTDGAPVRRAVHNLRAAVMERLGREGASSELPFEVARIIDEATQKIERL